MFGKSGNIFWVKAWRVLFGKQNIIFFKFYFLFAIATYNFWRVYLVTFWVFCILSINLHFSSTWQWRTTVTQLCPYQSALPICACQAKSLTMAKKCGHTLTCCACVFTSLTVKGSWSDFGHDLIYFVFYSIWTGIIRTV